MPKPRWTIPSNIEPRRGRIGVILRGSQTPTIVTNLHDRKPIHESRYYRRRGDAETRWDPGAGHETRSRSGSRPRHASACPVRVASEGWPGRYDRGDPSI